MHMIEYSAPEVAEGRWLPIRAATSEAGLL